MKKTLELTINLEVYEPPEGFLATPEAISRATGVNRDAVFCTTVFRGNGGFMAILSGIDRRLNLKTLMNELDNQWVTYPNKEELKELGRIDKDNPIALANDPRVTIIIDALLLKHKELAFQGSGRRLYKVEMSGLVIATRARPLGGISLPTSWK